MRLPWFDVRGRKLALAAALVLWGCGGGSSPSQGSGMPPPAATPVPTPAPTPAPGFGCAALPLPTGDGIDCPRQAAHFLEEMELAIDSLMAEEPDIFDFSDVSNGGIRILSRGRYYVGLIERLEGFGLCSTFDGEEMAVRDSNEYNDQYDVELSTGHTRRGGGMYRSTCRPAAAYPDRSPPGPSPPGCDLPPSVELVCGREPAPHFLAEVETALDEVLAERPELFDFTNLNRGTDWPLVVDHPGYVAAVAAALTDAGLCARWDGEELAVKSSNELNDQFDILLSSGHVRRGAGAYRSSCYPAAF